MDILTQHDLQTLMDAAHTICVSIFLPTPRAGEDIQKPAITLKNALKEAEQQLLASGLRRPEVVKLLAPFEALLPNMLFWREQSDGLALFGAAGFVRSYRLPIPFKATVVVGPRFHVKPLLPMLAYDRRFFILALSQERIRLLAGVRETADEVDLGDMPTGMREALGESAPERQLQFHTRSGGPGRRDAMFHGHGGEEETKQRIVQFFRRVDQGLQMLLGGEQAPLVLAGVEYLLPIYRQITRYPAVLDEAITGSPEKLSAQELHARAWPLVERVFRQKRDAAAARWAPTAQAGRTVTRLEEVVRAAHQGRVETLFVALDVERWGRFDAQSGAVMLHDQAAPDNEDLLGLAVIFTLRGRGAVYAVPSGEVPDGGPAAAILRY